MTYQSGSIDKNGLARTADGKLYVTPSGTASITGGNTFFIPSGGASGTAVSGAADTNENALATITLPALNSQSQVRVRFVVSYTNNANNKTFRARLGGIGGTVLATATKTTATLTDIAFEFANTGVTNGQQSSEVTIYDSGGSLSVGNAVTAAIETNAGTTLVISAQKATGTDTATLVWYRVEVYKP